MTEEPTLPASPPAEGALPVVAGRFRLEALVGAGGMGHVYRALDLERGVPVAIKLIRRDVEVGDGLRFAREASVLSQLVHPHIVSYVAHGQAGEGEPYIAMEWLEGEDLGQRLQRAPLTAGESVELARRVAMALDAAHQKGVVHRDLKPGNLFLRGGVVEGVTLVDFGIARQGGRLPTLTRTGMLVGTPEYMAPEQARGEKNLGPGVDLFALGCVLFECLTGRSPFAAEQVTAVLLRILLDAPTALRRLRPDLPLELEELVADLLAKEPSERVASAASLVARLEALPPLAGAPVAAVEPVSLGDAEQRLMSVLVAVPGAMVAGFTREAASEPTVAATEGTLVDATSQEGGMASLRAELEARGARTEFTADGALTAVLVQDRMSAVDLAAQCVAMARLVRERWPGCAVALATGRGVVGGGRPLGEAVARVGELFAWVGRSLRPGQHSGIFLDDVTAGLASVRARTTALGPGIATVSDDEGVVDATRPLLGKPTPCLGRESELGMLEAALRAVCDEGEARAMAVLGPPGIGKSRVLHEFLRRASQGSTDPLVLSARAEAGQESQAHGVVRSLLWRAFRLAEVEPAGRSARLRAALEARLPAELAWAGEFLGELSGVPFGVDESVRLRSARQDPRILRDQLAAAWLAWLRVESEARPVLVLLEDLHWGDRPSSSLLDAALRELHDRPLLMVAFARPELIERMPDLWRGKRQDLPLKPLGRRAAEQLVRQALGERPAAWVERVVAQSAGNALYLEELIRVAAEGETMGMPPTVLAMLQARIGRLDATCRRALRAASVFGESFLPSGVDALLGASATVDGGEGWLAALVKHELVEAPRAGSSEQEQPCRFRHALMRDAAYSLLTDEDRALGHRLAASFLEAHGDDPALVARHLVLGDRKKQAVARFIRAAERMRERNEAQALEEMAAQALDCEAEGEELGVILVLRGEACLWRVDFSGALGLLQRANPLLPRGGLWWLRCAQLLGTSMAFSGAMDEQLTAVCRDFLSCKPGPELAVEFSNSAAHLASACIQVGLTAEGADLLASADEAAVHLDEAYPTVRAWRQIVRCTLERHTHDDPCKQRQLAFESVRLYAEANLSEMMLSLVRNVLGELLCRSGEPEQGLALLRGSVQVAQRLNHVYLGVHSRLSLANGLLSIQQHPEAEALAAQLLASGKLSRGFEAMGRQVVAHARLAAGDLAAAEAEARAAIALSSHTPVRRLQMIATLCRALSRAGRAAEARDEATRALGEIGPLGGGYAELPLLAAAVEVHRAAGDLATASQLAARALRKLDEDAGKFVDLEARQRFLSGVPLHVEIRAMVSALQP